MLLPLQKAEMDRLNTAFERTIPLASYFQSFKHPLLYSKLTLVCDCLIANAMKSNSVELKVKCSMMMIRDSDRTVWRVWVVETY